MCGHLQAKVCPVSRLGYPELCRNSAHGNNVLSDTPTDVRTQDSHDLVLRNGKLGHRENGELLEYRHLIAHHTTLLNSIISTPNAKFMTMGIKDF